jgi:hypothetical protein
MGDIAEVINKKGIAKGGGWFGKSNGKKITLKEKHHRKPLPYIAFRDVMEVHKL